MPAFRPSWLIHVSTLLALTLPLPGHADMPRSPQQLIDRLGVDIRQALENPKSGVTPAAAEQAVADQISALVQSGEAQLLLTEAGRSGRTPLMGAVSGGYPLVVKALLADPGVRLQVNVRDAAGHTAAMLAHFAPTLTLVSCEPGTLTLERAQLLPPYLRRMSSLLQTDAASLVSIRQQLEAAGADMDPELMKRAWLARCPNTTPELRQALETGELMSTVINDAIARQLAFNKLAQDSTARVPSKPPKGMQFVHAERNRPGDTAAPLLLPLSAMTCVRMPKPELGGALPWSGSTVLKAVVSTRAGVVEAVDLTLIEGDARSPATEYFSRLILRALAGYQCEGDKIFEREFQFVVH